MKPVLIIDSDTHRREFLVTACEMRGIPTRANASVAEIRRWPAGQVVVTDFAHLSGLWADVGATHVIALVANADEARAAVTNGATEWVHRDVSVQAVAELLEQRRN